MCLCRDVSMPEEWGILSVGPTACKRPTVKSTLFCSAAFRPSHHRPNSSENSTSHDTYILCHGRHYAVKDIFTKLFIPEGWGSSGSSLSSATCNPSADTVPAYKES